MTQKLREYIDMLFAQAPATKKTVEVKEEILQNITDKYNDIIAEGKSEEAAYNIAVASIGDISELIRELKGSYGYDESMLQESEAVRKKRALLSAIAISLYITCVIPTIILQSVEGVVIMFVMIGLATAMLVYNAMTKPRYVKTEATMAEDFREWRQTSDNKSTAMRSIKSAIWSITAAIYLLISFTTWQWHITWVVFPLAAAAQAIVKAIYDLKGQSK